ncbi:MAG: 30S ribosomal protein S6 [Alphaproteobacteria bacterium]|nr:30S ribosomal protein S6 [Alphaproteobacteria bacterium]
MLLISVSLATATALAIQEPAQTSEPFVEKSIRRLYMTKYESVLIARQDLGTSQVNNIVSEMSNVISAQGGEVVRVDNWGLKNLAYRIKKNRKGHYVLLNISAPSQAIAEYERLLRVNEDIIRYMTVKVEDFSDALNSESSETSVVEE